MTNVTPLPVRRRSRLTTPGIARRESEKQPDSVTWRGGYSGTKLAEKGAGSGPAGQRTCPVPKGLKQDLSGSERNVSKPKPHGASKGEGNSAQGNVSVLKSDTRSLRQRYPLTYSSWDNMKTRARRFSHRVDPSWIGVDGFTAFLADMGPRPTAAFTLDRMDSSRKEYGPGLCRWASKKTQTQNRQITVHLIDASGVCHPLGEWATLKGVKPDTMLKRISRGWSDDEVIHGRRRPPPPRAQESTSTSTKWPPGDERVVECWKKMYANRAWKKESQLDYIHRTATETLERLGGKPSVGIEGTIPYLLDRLPPDQKSENPPPAEKAMEDRLEKATNLQRIMLAAREWALPRVDERNRKRAEAHRAKVHAGEWGAERD